MTPLKNNAKKAVTEIDSAREQSMHNVVTLKKEFMPKKWTP